MTEHFFQLAGEYAKAHPKEPKLHDHLNEFGDDELIRIMKEANGRKIVFEIDPTSSERDLDRTHTVTYE